MNNDNPQQEALPLDGKGLQEQFEKWYKSYSETCYPSGHDIEMWLRKTIAPIELKIKELELINYGIQEGSEEWQLKCSDLKNENRKLLSALSLCFNALCTYGSHPIISKQVLPLLNNVQNVQGSVATGDATSTTADNKNKNTSSQEVSQQDDRDAALVSFGNFLLSDKRKSDYPVVTDADIENWKEETKGGDV